MLGWPFSFSEITMEFLTLDEYKTILKIQSPAQDAEFTMIINAVNAFIQKYLGYSEGGALVKTIYAQGAQELLDDTWSTITSVVDEAGTSIAFSLVKGYILKFPTEVTGKLTITGTLAANTVDPALKQAAFSLIQYYLKNQYLKAISNGMDSISLTEYASVPVHIKSILDLFRLV